MPTKTITQNKSNVWKYFAVLFLIGVAGGFVYAQFQKVRPPTELAALSGPGHRSDGEGGRQGGGPPGGDGMPSREERQKMREEVFTQLNLSTDQRAQIDAILAKTDNLEGPEGMRTRMTQIREVLTPEQEAVAREAMHRQFQARLQERIKVLPPDQQEKFLEKFEDRRRNFESRMGRRGERGGEGPDGPDGPPPPPPFDD